MMGTTIVYLHGFRSSPASRKARVLADAVAELPIPVRPNLRVPELTDGPAAAIAAVLDLVHGIDRWKLSFVGSSLGGFYATHLAERLDAKAVLVNPAVRPYEDLRPYIGVQTNLYTGAEFEVTERHFDELRSLVVARISRPERFLLLAQAGDEVLDYRDAVRFYGGAWQWLQGGGDHAFVGFETVLPALLRFCGVVRRSC
jgi:predicted esterase YcpF (UPF0227 family)